MAGSDTGATLARMLQRLAHRGPDDSGIWSDERIALGHRRLAVIDLSPMGHQPMRSVNQALALTYNGEIYNYHELKNELERSGVSVPWRGHSDTEVLLACMEAWGIERTLQLCNGMFAIAVWDSINKRLTLARDRLGEKPLYLGWIGHRFAFASELKAFTEIEGWSPHAEDGAIASFLRFGYVRGVQSAIRGIFRLPPGCMLTLEADELHDPLSLETLTRRFHRFWSVEGAALAGLSHPATDHAGVLEELHDLLRDSISRRMVADVPIGSFLSGGIDSSLVTAMMQSLNSRPVRTFSIGFHDEHHNEAHYAKAVAAHIGTDHTELYLTADDALTLVPRLAETFDEPFADSSQLPTLLVSSLARHDVTVALSGDGGDEMFGGYARYLAILAIWRRVGAFPPWLRSGIAPVARSMALLARLLNLQGTGLPFKLDRFAGRMSATDIDELRLAFIGGAGSSDLQTFYQASEHKHGYPPERINGPLRRLMFGDQVDYLPDDILHKVDRASMAYALETRVPLLDHRLVELSWRIPEDQLVRGGEGKQPLRMLLDRYVPKALIDRPKQGFAPPLAAWLRGPLKDWAESLLSLQSLQTLPSIDTAKVRQRWTAHVEGHADWSQALWNVLMLADWRQRFGVTR
jgi:asparagine synthase (glutamine-hydrolysing)